MFRYTNYIVSKLFSFKFPAQKETETCSTDIYQFLEKYHLKKLAKFACVLTSPENIP